MKRILIIEDDKRVAQGLELRVKGAGYETTTAYDAIGGVMAAARLKPDAVLLDINIPAGNGFSVAQRIQAILPNPTPIIFITASRKPDLFDRAIEAGASGFIEKPYDPARLLELIDRVLEKTAGMAHTDDARSRRPWLSAFRPEPLPPGSAPPAAGVRPNGRGPEPLRAGGRGSQTGL